MPSDTPAPPATRYHLFADESGQHTAGKSFTVSVVIIPTQMLEVVRQQVVAMEQQSNRGEKKWSKSSWRKRAAFLDNVGVLLEQIAPVYYRACGQGTRYADWTAETIGAAAQARDKTGAYTVVVDGEADNARIFKEFRRQRLIRKSIRGGRDGSEPLLRLADFAAGFLADTGQESSVPYWTRLEKYFEPV